MSELRSSELPWNYILSFFLFFMSGALLLAEMLCEYLSSLPGFGANQCHHSKNLLQFTSPGASFRTVKLWGYRKMSAGEKRSSNLMVKIKIHFQLSFNLNQSPPSNLK